MLDNKKILTGLFGPLFIIISMFLSIGKDFYLVNSFFNSYTSNVDIYFATLLMVALIVNFLFSPFQEYFIEQIKYSSTIDFKILYSLSSIALLILILLSLQIIYLSNLSHKLITIINLSMLILSFPLIYLYSFLFNGNKNYLISFSALLFNFLSIIFIFFLNNSFNSNYPLVSLSLFNIFFQILIFIYFCITIKQGLLRNNPLIKKNSISFKILNRKTVALILGNFLLIGPFYFFFVFDFFSYTGNVTIFSLGIKPLVFFQVFTTFFINSILFDTLYTQPAKSDKFNYSFNLMFSVIILVIIFTFLFLTLFLPYLFIYLNLSIDNKQSIIDIFIFSVAIFPIIFFNMFALKFISLKGHFKFIYVLFFAYSLFYSLLFFELLIIDSFKFYISFFFATNFMVMIVTLFGLFVLRYFKFFTFVNILINLFLFLSIMLSFYLNLYVLIIIFSFLYLLIIYSNFYLKGILSFG